MIKIRYRRIHKEKKGTKEKEKWSKYDKNQIEKRIKTNESERWNKWTKYDENQI